MKRMILVCSFFLSARLLAAPELEPVEMMPEISSEALQPMSSEFAPEGIYQFSQGIHITPLFEILNEQVEFNGAGESIHFEEGEPIFLKMHSSGDVELRLLLSEEEKGVTPERIWISKGEFEKSKLLFVEPGDMELLSKNYSVQLSEDVAANKKKFKPRKRLHYRGASGCVAYVVRAIGWNKGRTGNGKDVTATLRRNGWRSVSCKNAPMGAVASWSGGRHGLGHAAVRQKGGWCYDLGCHDPGKRYKLLNCVMRGSKRS